MKKISPFSLLNDPEWNLLIRKAAGLGLFCMCFGLALLTIALAINFRKPWIGGGTLILLFLSYKYFRLWHTTRHTKIMDLIRRVDLGR